MDTVWNKLDGWREWILQGYEALRTSEVRKLYENEKCREKNQIYLQSGAPILVVPVVQLHHQY